MAVDLAHVLHVLTPLFEVLLMNAEGVDPEVAHVIFFAEEAGVRGRGCGIWGFFGLKVLLWVSLRGFCDGGGGGLVLGLLKKSRGIHASPVLGPVAGSRRRIELRIAGGC